MEIEFATMARFSEYAPDGTLTIVGAGAAGFYSQGFPTPQMVPGTTRMAVGTLVPAGIALQISCRRDEVGLQHTLRISIVDSAATTVFDSGDLPILQPQLGETGPNLPLTFQVPAFCGFAPSAFGLHTVHVAIDGVEKKTLAFVVVAPPSGSYR